MFHNNPPSVVRPRHRNRTVASQIVLDSLGREHLLLNFYVQTSGPSTESSYFDSISSWIKDALIDMPELSADSIMSWTSERARHGVETAKDLFRYLTGDPLPRSSTPTPSLPTYKSSQKELFDNENKGLWGSITGVFSTLRGANRSKGSDGRVDPVPTGTWHEGEVHVDLVKVGHSPQFCERILTMAVSG